MRLKTSHRKKNRRMSLSEQPIVDGSCFKIWKESNVFTTRQDGGLIRIVITLKSRSFMLYLQVLMVRDYGHHKKTQCHRATCWEE